MSLHDGYFLVRELCRRELNSSACSVCLLVAPTAYGRVDDKVKVLGAGLDSELFKLVEVAELSTIVRA
jgi:DNA-binding response OmpR family regulator